MEAQERADVRETNGIAIRGAGAADDPFDWFLLRDLSVAAERASRALAIGYEECAGLNLAEGRILLVLATFPSISAGEVTARTTMDKARVSRALSKLMLTGLVNRKAHRDDKRQAVLRLTAKGQRAAADIEAVARAVQAELLSRMSATDRTHLRRTLRKIQDCAAHYSNAGAGPE